MQADAHVRRCNGANEFERPSRKKERLKKERKREREIEIERERRREREREEKREKGGRRDGEPKKSGRDGTGE